MKKELSYTAKVFIAMTFSFVVAMIFSFFKGVYFVDKFGAIIYVLIGLLLPAVLLKSNIKLIDFSDSRYAKWFITYFAIATSISIEVFTFYLMPNYYEYSANSLIFKTFFPLNIIIELLTMCISFMYFSKIYELFYNSVRDFYAYFYSVAIFVLLTNAPIKNVFIGLCIFYVLHNLKNTNYTFLFMLINTAISIIFKYLFYFYIDFDIAHYFIFALMVIAFVMFEKTYTYAGKMMFKRELAKIPFLKPNAKEIAIFWTIVIFIGTYIVIY